MLDGLLGRGFSSKCKSLIKGTRTRIEVSRRREEATQRFLKGNLAQLLSNGLDINAFGRTEEFLSGLNSLACYDFLEQSCEYILKKLSAMQKHSECPEECREAVGSLMFAAARFSDLPELRDLRDALQERYGNSLEHFVDQKFVERLVMKPPTIDKKIQLLQDIALELSIKWDSRGFKKRMMANPSTPEQNQAKKQEPAYNLRIENEISVNFIKPDLLLKVKSDLSSHQLKAKNGGENHVMRKDELGQRSFGGIESTGNNGKRLMGSDQNSPQGRQVKDELSSDELRSKNGRENFHLRNEHNTNRRDGYSHTPINGDFRSYGTGAGNGINNNFLRQDEQGDLMGNRNCKPHIGLERNTPQRERCCIEGELNGDGLRAKHGGINYMMTKNEVAHLSYQQGDSTDNILKPHFDSDKKTVRREMHNISPLHGRELTGDENEPTKRSVKEETVLRRERHRSSSRGKRPDSFDEQNTYQERIYEISPSVRRELADNENEPTGVNGNKDTVHRREGNGSSSRGKRPEVAAGVYMAPDKKRCDFPKSYYYNFIADINELPSYREENTEKLKPKSNYALPPPYVKSKDKFVPPPYVKSSERKKAAVISDYGGASVHPTTHSRDDVEGRSERLRPDDPSDYGQEKDAPYRDNIPLPKPRSIRRKHVRSSSHRDGFGNYEDTEVVKRSSSSRRRDYHHSKKGLQILFDEEHKEKDNEERKIDKLLLHYSKKPSAYDEEKARRERKVKPHARETPHTGFNVGEDGNLPTRSVSLPREQINSDEVKIYARANSFQPDKPAGHVHPKLPDYDDLAAQFAALKGR